MVFIVTPFVLGFPGNEQTYGDYLAEIRFTKIQPLLGLILLGLSCYLIEALSGALGVLVYRLMQGLPVNGSFIRGSFVFDNELPLRFASWSILSIFEEIVWRGVILAVFLRVYTQCKAILFSALCFGLWHILSVIEGDGHPLVWTAGQVVWATIAGLFYGYVTIKSGSLLPAMIVHYLGNYFVPAINAYIQANASIEAVVVYGIVFTAGIIPAILMILWTRFFTTRWPIFQRP
jgi:membrane protease YdiL (CAAX protease family)